MSLFYKKRVLTYYPDVRGREHDAQQYSRLRILTIIGNIFCAAWATGSQVKQFSTPREPKILNETPIIL